MLNFSKWFFFIKISHKNSHIKRVYPPLKNFQIYIEIAIEELFSLLQEVRVLVFNATFNNISVIPWRSVLLVEEIEVTGENHRPAASHWQTLWHNVVSSTPRYEGDSLLQDISPLWYKIPLKSNIF